VVPLRPPAEAAVGELVAFPNVPSAPAEPGNKASKSFTKIADGFFVDENNVATYQKLPFMTSNGAVRCELKGKIS
jgi:hypothetical protein